MNTILPVLAIGAAMLVIERMAPGRLLPEVPNWWIRVMALNLVQAGAVWLTAHTWDRWLPDLRLWDVGELALGLQAALGYLVITFVYYWWHRARHEFPFLWRWLHQMHHSPARLEVVTSFYKHPLEILINGLLSSLILFLLVGVSPEAAGAAVFATGLAELFYHWNVRTPRWLGFLFQRPESHCVHHRRGRHCKNYSDLPLWDMLFGTFENPHEVEFACGFEPERELRLGAMLRGRDLHQTNYSRQKQ